MELISEDKRRLLEKRQAAEKRFRQTHDYIDLGAIEFPSDTLTVEAILDAAPAASISNDIRVIEYERDRRLDVAVVAPALQTQPRRDDIVCG